MNKFLLLLLLTVTQAIASPYVPWSRYPGDISIEAEWFYFSPNSEARYFAVQSTTGVREAVDFDTFHTGYRVAAAYAGCNCARFISVTWTSLKAHQSTDVANSQASTAIPPSLNLGDALFARADHHFNYYAVDTILGQRFVCNPCLTLDFFGGFQYAHVQTHGVDRFTFLLGGFELIEETANFWGYGPEVGICAYVPLAWNFSLVGNISGSILASKPRTLFKALNSELLALSFSNEPHWRLIPYGNIRFSLNYDFVIDSLNCISCYLPYEVRGSINIGYEAMTYIHALSSIRSIDDVAPLVTVEEYRNVSMHGPVAAISIYF